MAYDKLRGRALPIGTVAELVSVHKDTVRRWVKEDQIKAINFGARCTRIDGDSLADFMTRKTVGKTAGPACAVAQQAPAGTKAGKRRKASSRDLAGQA